MKTSLHRALSVISPSSEIEVNFENQLTSSVPTSKLRGGSPVKFFFSFIFLGNVKDSVGQRIFLESSE